MGYQTVFKMHRDDACQYEFIYTGHTRYFPNKSDRCGYGSDEWYYLCKLSETACVLQFEVNGAYGFGAWVCLQLKAGEGDKLKQLADAEQWRDLLFATDRKQIRRLQLENISDVRHILPKIARIGALEDYHYAGF